MEDDYELGWLAGWDACHKRFTDILARFPNQCAFISIHLPLHPSQPDEIIERTDWLQAQGNFPKQTFLKKEDW